MKKLGIGHTLGACFAAYIIQAIVVNFAPLLFLTFVSEFHISLTLIGLTITVNFGVQLLVDLAAAHIVDKIGYRPCLIAAHAFSAGGLVMLAFLPSALPVPWAGLFVASAVYAVGGGLLEVLISPITEALPFTDKKSKMSLLHSFYCWGQTGVILLSTLFFLAFGIENWRILACVWAALPVINGVFFLFVPLYKLTEEGERMPLCKLAASKKFWLFALLMLCAGSSEQCVSQWASAFAESGLHISKAVGDILGPCMFALCMGLSRLLFSKFGERIDIRRALFAASAGCLAGYMLCIFSPVAALSLVGCGIVGLCVAILWPGTLSYAAKECPWGGTAMFALFALAGDAGCLAGPTAVGAVSDACGGNIACGLAVGAAFPVAAMAVLFFFEKERAAGKENNLLK